MTAGPVGTYVFCVVAARTPPARIRTQGPPGTGRPRVVSIKPGRYLIVGDAPLDRFGEERLGPLLSDLRWVSRAAVAHEGVIQSLLPAVDAVVPMKLFTIFSSDERALAGTRSQWTRIERVLRAVAQHQEWGVRLSLVQQRTAAPEARPVRSGLGYLRAKQQLQTARAARTHEGRRQVAQAFRALAALASDTRRRSVAAANGDGRRLVLDAAFLVPRRRTERFRTAVKRQARTLAPGGYHLQLTGPWPPYSFIEGGP